jgi:hypothetical protein
MMSLLYLEHTFSRQPFTNNPSQLFQINPLHARPVNVLEHKF